LEEKIIPLSTIKWVSESARDFSDQSVGFTNADLEAFYGKKIRSMQGGDQYMERLKDIMDKPFSKLSDEELAILDKLGVPAWEMIQANSGGHKCITNISALNYFGRSNRPPQGKYKYQKDSGDAPYVKFAKMIQAEFVRLLKEKINQSKGAEQVVKEDMMRVGDEGYSNITVSSRAQNDYIPQQLLDDIATAAKIANVKVEISYAKKGHNKTTKSGNISRHWREMAVDLSRLQDLDNPEETKLQSRRRNREGFKVAGDRLCAALESLGYNRNSEGRRNPKAVLWYMSDGSHRDHLHVSNVTDDKPKEKKVSDIVKRDLTIADIIENGDNSELISTGSTGKGVEQIQQILVDNGYDLGTYGEQGNGVDGKFGSMTKSAIKKLQRDYDLQVDGIVGIETSNKLNELIK
jgi:hypothetical protein